MYRIVQEALINAFKHGKATRVDIHFWMQDSFVNLTIEDNGTGAVNAKMGLGQLGMQERLSKLGGEVSFTSLPSGYSVLAVIPTNAIR
jgi:two-component system sensor histidine kinase DegS